MSKFVVPKNLTIVFLSLLCIISEKSSAQKAKRKVPSVPPEVISPCLDTFGRIDGLDEQATKSNPPALGGDMPYATLIMVCNYSEDHIEIFCGKSGYSPSIVRVEGKRKNGKWTVTDNTKQPSHEVKVECKSKNSL